MTTSAFATLLQIMILKRPRVRMYLDLPDLSTLVAKKTTGMLAQKPMSMADALSEMRRVRIRNKA
jgi:hypothetical protein